MSGAGLILQKSKKVAKTDSALSAIGTSTFQTHPNTTYPYRSVHRSRSVRGGNDLPVPTADREVYDASIRFCLPTDPEWYRLYVGLKSKLRAGELSLIETSQAMRRYARERRCNNMFREFFAVMHNLGSLEQLFKIYPVAISDPRPSQNPE